MGDVPRRNVRKLSRRRQAGGRRVGLERNHQVRTRIFRSLVHDIEGRSGSVGHGWPAGNAWGWNATRARAASRKAAASTEIIAGVSAVAKTVGVPMIHCNGGRGDSNRLQRR